MAVLCLGAALIGCPPQEAPPDDDGGSPGNSTDNGNDDDDNNGGDSDNGNSQPPPGNDGPPPGNGGNNNNNGGGGGGNDDDDDDDEGGGGMLPLPDFGDELFVGDAAYQQQGNECLAEIAGYGGFGADLLNSLEGAPLSIVHRPNDMGDVTYTGEPNDPFRPGDPITITTGTLTGNYGCDGAPKDWCATLFHELQHADDFYHSRIYSRDEDEFRGVWAENWFRAQKGLCQRNCYSDDPNAPALPQWTLWDIGPGECRLALTVINETPDYILIKAGDDETGILCGSGNEYFRADERRACTMRMERGSSNNPFAVPLVTLIAYYPSGDPNFPFGGTIEWFAEDGTQEQCDNAFPEFCRIAMGESGVDTATLAKPRSRTITVRYTGGAENSGDSGGSGDSP